VSPRPTVFISAVSKELKSSRQPVSNTLQFPGYEPVWQDIFGTERGGGFVCDAPSKDWVVSVPPSRLTSQSRCGLVLVVRQKMKKLPLIIIIASLVISGCSTIQKTSQPKEAPAIVSDKNLQDGLSFDSAVVIQAKNESEGVAAEYAWIRKNLSGASPAGQSLHQHAGKFYDVISVELNDGKSHDVYFEISSYFGKF
jgi:hypothetical protein